MAQQIAHSLVKALRKVPAFSTLEDHDLLQIVGASMNLHWPADSLVFEEGTEAEALYILLSGCVRIFVSSGSEETDVANIQPGEYFGELSLLRDETHSKSAQATQDSDLMILSKESFRALLDYDAELAAHVKGKMHERLRANDEILGIENSSLS
jgi:CRP/FNR family transcriptional regulator, cyclic AMP receptor protein